MHLQRKLLNECCLRSDNTSLFWKMYRNGVIQPLVSKKKLCKISYRTAIVIFHYLWLFQIQLEKMQCCLTTKCFLPWYRNIRQLHNSWTKVQMYILAPWSNRFLIREHLKSKLEEMMECVPQHSQGQHMVCIVCNIFILNYNAI